MVRDFDVCLKLRQRGRYLSPLIAGAQRIELVNNYEIAIEALTLSLSLSLSLSRSPSIVRQVKLHDKKIVVGKG